MNGPPDHPRPTIADQPSRPVAWSRYRDGVFVGIFEGPTDPRTVHDPGPRFEFRPLVEATTPPAIPDSRPTTLDRDGIAPHIAQYRQRRASVPSDRVVVSGDGPPYVRGLGDTTGAARITCPSLDVAYVVHDAMVIADVLLDTPPALPADLRALLEALVATRDALDALPEIDEVTAIAKYDAEDALIAWTRAHAGGGR